MKFVHLHTHSHYSLLDGLAKIDELINKAKEDCAEALALTDHGVMYGVIEFYQKAKAAGIKPIIGCESYIVPHSRHQKGPLANEERHHLILLAKNQVGYHNLIRLTTYAHLEGFYYKPRIDWELLEKYHQGLIGLSACLQGEIPTAILSGNLKKTEDVLAKYLNLFGREDFYLELQHHPTMPEQARVNKALLDLAKKFKVQVVATNDVHYLNKEDAEAQDILLCLQTKKKREDKDRMSFLGEDFSFKSQEEMIASFHDCPEAIQNTVKIAESCDLEIELGKVTLPHFEVPSGKTADEFLHELCLEGLALRYGKRSGDAEYLERLDYELKIIKKTGFASFFLIVQDFVNWAKKQNIVVGPGRGSAAGSLVSYVLNITDIDPLIYDLLFERFLNPERVSMPDFDLDFADIRREEVIRYVEEKYGRDRVAQIITFGTMAARAAIRDVGRVMALSYSYCDKIAKMIPFFSSLSQALNTNVELRELYLKDPNAKELLETAKKLEGVARHASTHACGVLITREPLYNYVPLQFASSGDKTIVSQYSLHPIEDLGLLKMDFLGLKNLTLIENVHEIVQKTRGEDIKIEKIPLDDKKTYRLLQRGETTGVFQLESSGMRRYLKMLKPTEFEDIIAMVALYRPGPMEWIPDFIDRKHGQKKIVYLHSKLEPILKKTYGVAIYQEQVMKIARELAGFTLGEADILRKAVGKKIPHLLTKQKKKFIEGCVKNNVSAKLAEQVFSFIEPFAGYGFNRSHAACYAMIGYQTAYLKANFPVEFVAALLTSEEGSTEKINLIVQECLAMGIEVLPPDINESFKHFTVLPKSEKPTIRFGLLAIKNVGENVINVIVHERKQNGSYQNLEDFLSRIKCKDLNKKSLESLIKSGALDRFGERAQMLYNIEKILSFIKEIQKNSQDKQANLFGATSSGQFAKLNLEKFETASEKQKLTWEKELLGLYISAHPFKSFEPYLKEIMVNCYEINKLAQKENDIEYVPDGEQNPPNLNGHNLKGLIKMAGVITKIQKVFTRSGEPMIFANLEDTTGKIEILVFPSTLNQTSHIWQEEKIVIVLGKLSDKEGVPKLLCQGVCEVTPLNVKEIAQRLKRENR
ncbi:MAG: DNA polymerase III subunit alpha [bacterium]